jgi:hypothetical protein
MVLELLADEGAGRKDQQAPQGIAPADDGLFVAAEIAEGKQLWFRAWFWWRWTPTRDARIAK